MIIMARRKYHKKFATRRKPTESVIRPLIKGILVGIIIIITLWILNKLAFIIKYLSELALQYWYYVIVLIIAVAYLKYFKKIKY